MGIAVTGLVMAGGRSRRMGMDKATVLLEGQTLLDRTVAKLQGLCSEIIVVGREADPEGRPGIKWISDVRPGCGPLGGLYSGLLAATSRYCLAAACDMPFLSNPLLAYLVGLADKYDVVMPRLRNELQPFPALYSKSCTGPIAKQMETRDLKMTSFLADVRVRFVEESEMAPYDPDNWSFFSVNIPADLIKAQSWMKAGANSR